MFRDLALLLVGAGRAEEGLEAAEAGRARAFADLLAQRRRPRSDPRGPAALPTAGSTTVADVRATAKRLQATLVEYLVTEGRLLAWVVDPRGALHVASSDVTRERLDSLTKSVRAGIDTVDPAARRRTSALRGVLRELDRLLIGPVVPWLPASPEAPLIVIPHGPLALVPFAALEDETGRPLVERYTLSFAPAASVYQHTQGTVRAGERAAPRLLVVADPTPPAESAVARLPWAREEGQRIVRRFHGMPVRLLTGSAASEAAVKREASAYSRLHFAAHGLVAPDRPLASSLLLAAGEGEDGYLRVDEIFDLDLAADLVVLSGCSTGLGRLTGDGILGFTRAFIYAGAPTVVVSQWDVSDRTTAFLMDSFYGSLRAGQAKAAALRAAQLATRSRFPHPAMWAAFTVVGEPR